MHGWIASKTMSGLFRHRDHAGQCRCHGNDIMAEGSDEAVQAGRFSLKEVKSDSNGSDPKVKSESNGSDLTSKRHDREKDEMS